MSDLNLSQTEADALMAMIKRRANDDVWGYPDPGEACCIPLVSDDRRESFILDISRGRIDLLRGKFQNRAREAVILLRLDFGGPPHRNPDDQEIPCPHLHVYKEGFADKWAYPAPPDAFANLLDRWQTLHDFMRHCNIVDPPRIRRGVFT